MPSAADPWLRIRGQHSFAAGVAPKGGPPPRTRKLRKDVVILGPMTQRPFNLLLLLLIPAMLVACPEKNTEPSESPPSESGDKAGAAEQEAEGEVEEEAEEEGAEKEEESDDEGGW